MKSIRNNSSRASKVIQVCVALFGFESVASHCLASDLPRAWFVVYEQLNPGGEFPFHSADEARQWAKEHSADIVPIVIGDMNNSRNSEWISMLAVARVVRTPEICEAITRRLADLVNSKVAAAEWTDREEIAVMQGLEILIEGQSLGGYEVCDVAVSRSLPGRVVEQLIAYCRAMPDARGHAILERVCQASSSSRMADLCETSRAVIAAVLKDRQHWEAEARTQISAVAVAVASAISGGKIDKYEQLRGSGGAAPLDQEHWEKIQSKWNSRQLSAAVQSKLQNREEIILDLTRLEARLALPDGLEMRFHLESDGWKISRPF